MTTEMIKYPKIGQFRDAAHEIKRRASFQGLDEAGEPIMREPKRLPELTFQGAVKLHGTNGGVVCRPDGAVHYQSRNRILTPTDDNNGFASFAATVDWSVMAAEARSMASDLADDTVAIYGEWCGRGIQKGVGISELPKQFFIFGIRAGGEWLNLRLFDTPDDRVHFIVDFPTFELVVDLNASERDRNRMIEMTDRVEAECPVAKAFGVSGIGEGIVWRCMDDGYRDIAFKVKGEKHSKAKVRTLAPADAERAERLRALGELLMTEERMKQGIDYLDEHKLDVSRRNLGAYLSYVVSDCCVEENLTIHEQGFEPKDVKRHLSDVARRWFFEREAASA